MQGRFSPSSLKAVRTALRSFFRFLRVEGLCDERLEAAIPTVARWRLATLPRYLSDAQLARVLASLEASSLCGQRDRAIVVLLASLGLRPGEVAGLRLEDIDWRAGSICLRERKTRRGAVVPLPREAGRALVAYLREQRPATEERRVFVQQQGVRCGEPISSNAVFAVVARVLRRAGVDAPLTGAYLFRHTVASRMVRRGASLKEVADFFGHRSLDTTAIYAKLDLEALREVALPWPEVAAMTASPSSFRPLVEEYLAYRCGLGFALDSPAWQLRDFARYADRVGHEGPLSRELAVGWALCSRSSDPAQAARRLATVRQFARYRALFDPATEVPPAGLLGRVPRRRQPHIYNDAELGALLEQASLLLPRRGLRPTTYVAFFSLLAATGLRLSEACRLEDGDVDLDAGVLTIRAGKFRKARLVPLHPSATAALSRYATCRDARCEPAGRGRFFRTDRCPALTAAAVEKAFSRIRERLGWSAEGRARRPRIHDLRHTFAVRRLLRWYEEGAELEQRLLALSTYLGHAHVTDTYWYLSGVPELLAVAAQRFERFAGAEQEHWS